MTRRGVAYGILIWFDPEREVVKLFQAPHRDGRVVPRGKPDGVDKGEGLGYLDKVISVSGADEGEDCILIDDEVVGRNKETDELPF